MDMQNWEIVMIEIAGSNGSTQFNAQKKKKKKDTKRLTMQNALGGEGSERLTWIGWDRDAVGRNQPLSDLTRLQRMRLPWLSKSADRM